MTIPQARQILILRRPGGADDEMSEVRDALSTAEGDPALMEELSAQRSFDEAIAAELDRLQPDDHAAEEIEAAFEKFSGRRGGIRLTANPATIAVAIGFLLLVAVLTWHFMGEAGLFPDEAVKIGTAGEAADSSQFDPVENSASQLKDWFMLKGYDSFELPAGFENFHVAGVRLFRSNGALVAQAAIVENTMFFYSFPAQPLGITVVPEGTWRIREDDHKVLAIREDRGTCFMIVFRGKKADMEALLRKVK